MTYFIDNFNQWEIEITNLWQTWRVPKFAMYMTVDEPYLIINYANTQKGGGGLDRVIKINYLDVADGYGGYADNPSSAANLKAMIEAMQSSGFSAAPSSDILTAPGDLLGHNGTSDEIIPIGTNEYILSVDTSEATKIKWIPNLGTRQKQLSIGTIAHSPADSTTYYWGGPAQQPVNGAIQPRRKMFLHEAATITECYIEMLGTSGGGTTENISMYIQVNGVTDHLIQTTGFPVGSYTCSFANAALGISLLVTDWFVFKMDTPAWAVNPAQVYYSGKIVYTV